MPETTNHQYLNVVEAALVLRRSACGLQNDVTRSPATIPPFMRVGRRILFPVAQLHEFLNSKIANNSSCNVFTNKTSLNPKRGRPTKKSLVGAK